MLFAAEWGDLSQLATAGLAARYDDPVSVFIGSWAALLVVAGLAVFLGKKLADKLPIRLIRIDRGGPLLRVRGHRRRRDDPAARRLRFAA